VEYEMMSAMKYDASTLGNHDFDNGISGLLNTEKHRNFDLLNCNYDFSNSALSSFTKTHKIIEKDGLTIGIIGVGLALSGLVPDANFTGIVYKDPIIAANQWAKKLKKQEKCDLIICLSHLGYQYKGNKVSDQNLAAASSDIDVILGGHTHTFLDKPQEFLNANKKPIIVNQAGWAALRLGRVDLALF
jgi:5'-nucleotidase